MDLLITLPQAQRRDHRGLDRVAAILVSVTVVTRSGAMAELNLSQLDHNIVQAEHGTMTGEPLLDSMPEWMRREIGFAALAAQGETL